MNDFKTRDQLAVAASGAGQEHDPEEMSPLEKQLYGKTLAEIQNALGPAGSIGKNEIFVETYGANGKFEAAILAIAEAVAAKKQGLVPGPKFVSQFSELDLEFREVIGEALVQELDNDQILEGKNLAELTDALLKLNALQKALPASRKMLNQGTPIDFKFLLENYVRNIPGLKAEISNQDHLNNMAYSHLPQIFGLRSAAENLAADTAISLDKAA